MPPVFAIISPLSDGPCLTLATVVGVSAMVGLLVGRRAIQGTTLVAPAIWFIVSIVAVTVVEWLILTQAIASAASTCRYLAAITSLCPAMAILGAKRPQDRGWQFIVLSLYLVLALPAGQALAFAPGGRLELHAAWQWFLVILVATGLTNHLPTRYGLPALLVAGGQYLLLKEHWPLFGGATSNLQTAAGILLGAGAILLVCLGWRCTRSEPGWNRVWSDFRDSFGAVWAVRIAERINHSARVDDWPLRLTWKGFVAARGPSSFTPEMELGVRTLLRRFVPPRWIDERLPEAHQRGPSD